MFEFENLVWVSIVERCIRIFETIKGWRNKTNSTPPPAPIGEPADPPTPPNGGGEDPPPSNP